MMNNDKIIILFLEKFKIFVKVEFDLRELEIYFAPSSSIYWKQILREVKVELFFRNSDKYFAPSSPIAEWKSRRKLLKNLLINTTHQD